jgi:hypothetical protein
LKSNKIKGERMSAIEIIEEELCFVSLSAALPRRRYLAVAHLTTAHITTTYLPVVYLTTAYLIVADHAVLTLLAYLIIPFSF